MTISQIEKLIERVEKLALWFGEGAWFPSPFGNAGNADTLRQAAALLRSLQAKEREGTDSPGGEGR